MLIYYILVLCCICLKKENYILIALIFRIFRQKKISHLLIPFAVEPRAELSFDQKWPHLRQNVCFLESWILKAKICFIIYFISICMSNTNFQENSTFSVYGFCHLLLRVTEILLLRSVQ